MTGASATAQDNERRSADIQASGNLGDGMAIADDPRDDIRAFANFSPHRGTSGLNHGSQAPSQLTRPLSGITRWDRE